MGVKNSGFERQRRKAKEITSKRLAAAKKEGEAQESGRLWLRGFLYAVAVELNSWFFLICKTN